MNQNSIVKRDRPIVVERPKEKTARDKAIEFAKNNVPKPKAKVKEENENLPKKIYGSGAGGSAADDDYELELNDRMFVDTKQGSKGQSSAFKSNDLQMLDQRHEAYLDEVEKIKR